MAYVNVDNLNPFFEKGEDFSLTDEKYEKLTGKDLPKNKYYLTKNSALAKRAKKYGYTVSVVPKVVIFSKEK